MCSPVSCPDCAKVTWQGCGAHVAELRATVPADQWCGGHHDRAAADRPGRLFTRGGRR